ncbi:MAG: hypothetical protein JW724_08250 [Candidatus Altiarchaeota archaeon]|nr:hypothetical protein [Candidatus Altiarchaeota archaeon]
MTRTVTVTLLPLIFGALGLSGCSKEGTDISALDLDPDFAGSYKVSGDEYAADLTIEKTGKNYHMLWEFEGTASKTYGKGIELNGILGAVFADIVEQDIGTIVFIKEGETLRGLWTGINDIGFSNEKTRGTKNLVPAKPDIAGAYTTEGTRPDGSEYTGRLKISSFGKRFTSTWKIAKDEELSGAGIVLGNVLVLGYGGTKESRLAVYEIKGSELEGSWLYSETIWLNRTSPLPLGSERCVKTKEE